MGNTDYAYAVANIRANEYKLFTKADFRGFLSASSADDIIRVLKDRGFGVPSSYQSDDEMLKSQNAKVFSYLKDLSEENKIFDSFLMKNDFYNLKIFLKARIAEKNGMEMASQPSLIEPEVLQSCVQKNDFSTLPDWIRETAENAFELISETRDGQQCDIMIDKAMMNEIRNTAVKSKNQFMIEMTEMQTALSNIKTALRANRAGKDKDFILNALIPCDSFSIEGLAEAASDKETLIEFLAEKGYPEAVKAISGGESIAAFERYCDDQTIKYAETVKYSNFGIEPLIAFLLYNEMEQKNLQIILTGKRAGINEKEIMERMRESYA